MKPARIIIVDDERTIRLTFRFALETDGYAVVEAASLDEAMICLDAERFDLAILDLRLGDESGLDVLAAMRQRGITTPTLMITAYGNIRHAVRAMQLGAIDFLEKPIEPEALRTLVAAILRRHEPAAAPGGPQTLHTHLQEAKRLINLQKFDAAAEEVNAALRLDAHSSDALNLQGILHEIAGDYEAARKSYGQAMRFDARHEGAQQNLRRLYELFNFGSSVEALHLGDER